MGTPVCTNILDGLVVFAIPAFLYALLSVIQLKATLQVLRVVVD